MVSGRHPPKSMRLEPNSEQSCRSFHQRNVEVSLVLEISQTPVAVYDVDYLQITPEEIALHLILFVINVPRKVIMPEFACPNRLKKL